MENTAKHYFYVLQCGDGSLYAGYTNHLERRVAVHNAGKGAKYTRARLPVICIYFEEYATKREAMQQEYAFKQLTREKKEIYISGARD
ncbi:MULTISPECIES: GIY-YIG nuclease family protein [Bacillales]|uniref:GIY-YIG nuclease family protein n=1 Tax=Lysinibacillus louembei TaxID=1470088 RepID=A0ABZ0S197_9BACI|nr:MULTISPECIES: GIY-YIG nuclease family protein [Bacillales]MCT6926049.1 GIY-YIG nuclease family protein [Metasolibacillus sp.]MCT6942231.1 GIY-YIG nuclease family protein [Metasolibacillus sp.]WPK12968.1 GIY-YIG nuclease family protein [Lysinibacillus louembei]